MTICAPKNKWELSDMLKFAVNYGAPIAIRYPRGNAYDGLKEFRAPVEAGKCEVIYEEKDICLFYLNDPASAAARFLQFPQFIVPHF